MRKSKDWLQVSQYAPKFQPVPQLVKPYTARISIQQHGEVFHRAFYHTIIFLIPMCQLC